MKYAIFSVIALALCIGAAVLTVRAIGKNRNRKLSRLAKAVAGLALFVVYLAAAGLIYFEMYYHADAGAEACLDGSADVTVSKTENGYLFDGPGDEAAIIFYPGAKVETEAYAPLMLSLAESGEDAFLVDMPMRFAFFGTDSADKLINSDRYGYDSWYLMGHSMGGLAACSYVESNPGVINGLIFLASYPNGGPYEGVKMLSIYGTEDKCLSSEEYQKSKALWPKDTVEVVIEGGNHAQFGSYGEQNGDGDAAISSEKQLSETTGAITEWINENTGE